MPEINLWAVLVAAVSSLALFAVDGGYSTLQLTVHGLVPGLRL